MLWCVSCPALADYGVSHALPWYPLAILLVSSGWLWYVSWCAMVMLWYVSVLSSGCALVCLIAGYVLMMSCIPDKFFGITT